MSSLVVVHILVELQDGRLLAVVGIYEYKNDFSLKNNLIEKKEQFSQLPFMQQQMEAILQQYITRMEDNKLTWP